MFALGKLASRALPFLSKAIPRAASMFSKFKGGNIVANAIKGARGIQPTAVKGFGGISNFLNRGSNFLTRGIGLAEKAGKGVDMAREAGLIPSTQSSAEIAARRRISAGKRVRDDVDRLSGGARAAQKFARNF